MEKRLLSFFGKNGYLSEWGEESLRLSRRSIIIICIAASALGPFYCFFEYACCPERFRSFLIIMLSGCLGLLAMAFFTKKYQLPGIPVTYLVSIMVSGIFSYMASVTDIDKIQNYLLGACSVTLVGGLAFFGKPIHLLTSNTINNIVTIVLLSTLRREPFMEIPGILSLGLLEMVVLIFSYIGMSMRYKLTQDNFINALKLKKAFTVIEEKNKDITESISYARRIQTTILPDALKIRDVLKHHFILYLPKDIVSGDFYWFHDTPEMTFIAVVDCTGHGVPGAFMSVMGYNLLNQIVIENKISDPAAILHKLDEQIRISLRQNEEGSQSNDGMDMALCAIHKNTSRVDFGSANRSLIYIHQHQLQEIKGDKFPIGGQHFLDKQFHTHTLTPEPGDSFYLFTDGFGDQFGGNVGKKFTRKKLIERLLSISHEPFQKQHQLLSDEFNNWKQGNEQIDDVTVVGFAIE